MGGSKYTWVGLGTEGQDHKSIHVDTLAAVCKCNAQLSPIDTMAHMVAFNEVYPDFLSSYGGE